MCKKLPPVPYDHTPNILLIGNGILRAFGGDSWNDLIDDIMKGNKNQRERDTIHNLPYSLQIIAASDDSVNSAMQKISSKMIASKTPNQECEDLIRLIVDRYDCVLTTNYSYELERTLIPDFYIKPSVSSKFRFSSIKGIDTRNDFCLHQYMEACLDSSRRLPIWHIHGEAAKPSTMIMGQYFYGKHLSKFEKEISEYNRRYAISKKAKREYIPNGWVDYFLMGDVDIIGFGMDFCETDIWWLICSKKRNDESGSRINWYELSPSVEKRAMAEVYGINVISDTDIYKQFYTRIANNNQLYQ